MNKFRPPLLDHEIKELLRLSLLDISDFNETDIREEFLVELCKILGYRRELDYSVSREETFRLNPLFLSVGSNRIKLDYLCSLRKQYFWIIDAKTGKCKEKSNPPEIKKEEIAQAHFYSLHSEVNCRYFIVSNGWYTNLYERDNLDDDCTPLLTIRQADILNRFLELDRYVGATQILPTLKAKIIDQVEKIFSAEIREERLDEFIEEISKKAALTRSVVRKNATSTYYKNSTQDNFRELKTGDISKSVYSIFQNLRTRHEIEYVAKILTERIKQNHHKPESTFNEFPFFRRLSLIQPYPVNFWYYPAVLHFLFQANKEGITTVFYGQRTIQELLSEWIDVCIFHLSNRKGMRYLWACERLYAKITKQSVLLLPVCRDNILGLLNKELFYLPEENLAPLGPNQASTMINIIETSLNVYRSRFLKTYYDADKYRFKETLANQEFKGLTEISVQFEKNLGEEYKKIKQELGDQWSDLQGYEYPNFDRMGSAVCDILLWNKDELSILTDKQKQRIKLMAELNCTNFADEVCDELSIGYTKVIDEKIRLEAISLFFDPAIDQYNN